MRSSRNILHLHKTFCSFNNEIKVKGNNSKNYYLPSNMKSKHYPKLTIQYGNHPYTFN